MPENNDTFLVEILYTSPGIILETGQVIGNTANPYNYEWNTGATSSSITPEPINRQYWLLLTDTNGCVSDTAFYNITDLISSTEELTSENILIYPNPTNGKLFIESKNNISKIDVLNYLGELVLSKEIKKQSQLKNYTINLSKFSKGIYHIQITINNQLFNNKIILQ